MQRRSPTVEKSGAGQCLVLLALCALLFQALLLPVQRLGALTAAEVDAAALSALCAGGDHHPDGPGSGNCGEMPCCILASRLDLAATVLPEPAVVPVPAYAAPGEPVAYRRPPSRAPPRIATAPLQPRAPPTASV